MATTEIILREKIEKLGAEADVVKVKAGYARNFLIPQGKAYEASEQNLKHVETLQQDRAEREAKELVEAHQEGEAIKKLSVTFPLTVGQDGKAFGSVTSIDIHKELEKNNINIDRKAIQLANPIKTSGKHDVEIKLHPDVTVKFNFSIEVTEA